MEASAGSSLHWLLSITLPRRLILVVRGAIKVEIFAVGWDYRDDDHRALVIIGIE
jgi:hypothetical protein